MEVFGEFRKEVETLFQILKPLIKISLDFYDHLDEHKVATKGDGSVVTICDFALQALIMSGIRDHFPNDKVFGEESLSSARPEFLERVAAILPPAFDPAAAWKIAIKTISVSDKRVWVIDPVDGTEGFINGGHYAIATALLIDRQLAVSIVAWPRHSPQLTGIPIDGSAIFAAAVGKGAFAFDLEGRMFPVRAPGVPRKRVVYSGPTPEGIMKRLNEFLASYEISDVVPIVSMVKGIIVGCGGACLYRKLHGGKDIAAWDVAPVELFVKEAGGYATLVDGRAIEYTEKGLLRDGSIGVVYTSWTPEFHTSSCRVFSEILGVECKV